MGIFYFLTLGAKVEENQVFYLMKWKYGVSHSIITSQTAKEKAAFADRFFGKSCNLGAQLWSGTVLRG